MKQEVFQKITESHEKWLNGEGGERADLTRADLTRANLTGANLTGANLTGANLTGADLGAANLATAILTVANLTRANLTGANLTGANLTGANLTGADLTGANLYGADLYSAKQVILQFTASRHQVVSIDDEVMIGCMINPLGWWIEHYQKVGNTKNYTPVQIEEYGLILRHIEAVLKIRKTNNNEKSL